MKIKSYMRRAIEVTAVQFTDDDKNSIFRYMTEKRGNIYATIDNLENPIMMIPDINGGNEQKVELGNWIIMVGDNIHVLTDENFKKNYFEINDCNICVFNRKPDLPMCINCGNFFTLESI